MITTKIIRKRNALNAQVTERSVGKTCKVGADCVVGAALGSLFAACCAALHGRSAAGAGVALFAQATWWAYVELPLPCKRLALSTMVMVCLESQRAALAWAECAALIGVVALGVGSGLSANVLLGPLGTFALPRARQHADAARVAARLIVERGVAIFVETDETRQQVVRVQVGELARVARSSLAHLGETLEDAQWEPGVFFVLATRRRVAQGALRDELAALERVLDLMDGAVRALVGLPLSLCHTAFADRLAAPLQALVDATVALEPFCSKSAASHPSSPDQDGAAVVEAAIISLYEAYGRARHELLYPDVAARSRALTRSVDRSWTMDDLLHMNTLLFTMMHLAAHVVSHHRRIIRDKAQRDASPWPRYVASLASALRPSRRLDVKRLKVALRFATAISLAALVCLVPTLSARFSLEVWAPVEVTSL